MESGKCEYCGVIQPPAAHKCVNCGGLLTQKTAQSLKLSNKKGAFLAFLVIILLISPLAYQQHIENTSDAILKKLQVDRGESGLQTSTVTHFKIKASFTQALIEITPIKIMVTEHYQSMGTYPATLSEIGLNGAELDAGQFIQAIHLSKKGSIKIRLAPAIFGNNKTFTLTPRLTMGGMNMKWVCTSNLESHLIANLCKPGA